MAGTADRSSARIDRSPETLLVALGDLLLIGLFVLVGELRHWGLEYLLANPMRLVGTATPFLLGWIAGSLILGTYSRTARRTPKTATLYAAGTWLIAVVIGQTLRATSVFHGDFAISFALVSLAVGLVLLVPWRVLTTWL
ncbi:DUF3054 domain-containing protein [Halocatena halophila]|uniref:DUF3054 domain-containing protein n=1 Tax=Halocatena halophila TaxID=2814576 RepID=UPI002ED433F9